MPRKGYFYLDTYFGSLFSNENVNIATTRYQVVQDEIRTLYLRSYDYEAMSNFI